MDPTHRAESLSGLAAKLLGCRHRSLPEGTVWDAHFFFAGMQLVVEQGVAAVRRGRVVLDLLGPEDALGVGQPKVSLAGEQYDVVALTPVCLLVLPIAQYMAPLARDPALAGAAARVQARTHTRLLERLAAARQPDVVRRVAAVLALELEHVGTVCPLVGGRFLSLPQDLLASLCGLSRQAFNEALSELKAARLVHVERRFVCAPNLRALSQAAGGRLRISPAGRRSHCKLRHSHQPLDCGPAAP